MNLVFDLGAVLVQWQPQDLLRQHFPNEAGSPEQAKALAGDFFHHADWMSFDRGALPMDSVIARTGERLGLPGPAVASLVTGIGDYLTALPDTVALLARLAGARQHPSSVLPVQHAPALRPHAGATP